MDERPSRAHEPNDQGSHCSTLSLRSTRSARSSPCRIHQRLQLRPSAEDPKGPHPLRIYLQTLDFPPRTIQTQSAPDTVGTKHPARRAALLRTWQIFLQQYPVLLMPRCREPAFELGLEQADDAKMKRIFYAGAP